MISARSVNVAIGRKRILHDVSVEALPAAVTAIIGPNGSGKTTLLKALSGELAYEGTVSMNGRSLSELKPWQAAAMRAVLPQAAALSFPFTVREVVGLGLTNARPGMLPGEENNLPERALSRVGLAGYGGRHYQELSGACSLRGSCARCGHRSSTASRAISCSTSRSPTSTSSTSLRSCASRAISRRAAAVSSPCCTTSI
jgi:iron complex transport system ATP-binding protein